MLIKPRGNKPSGLAIIAEIHSTKVLDETVLFYDVEFLEGGAKEFAVNEMFVVNGSLSELEAIANLGRSRTSARTAAAAAPPSHATETPQAPNLPHESDADKLYKVVKEAEQAFAAAEKGKNVFVRPRGETKPGGIAKVEAIWPTKIAKDYMLLYDVEYPLGQKEKGINELFVVCGTLPELTALVATYQEQQGQGQGSTGTSSDQPVVPQQVTVEPDLSKIRRAEKETVRRFMDAQKGKHIFVKHHHGERKPGGLAVVEGIWPTMTNTGKYEIFYSVKYVENGTKESGIHQRLVITGAISELQALAKEGASS